MQAINQAKKVKLEISAALDADRVAADFIRRFPQVEMAKTAQATDIVVIYPALDAAIATALRDGSAIQVALDSWSKIIQEILRQRTSKTVLVEATVLSESTDAIFALADRLDTSVTPFTPESSDDVVSENLGILYTKLARTVMAGLAHKMPILAEVQARSFHVTSTVMQPHDVDALARQLEVVQTAYQAQREELRHLVDTTQDAFEKQRFGFQAKAQEVERKTRDVLGLQKLKDNEIMRLKKEVKSLRSSTSWRITAPLRWVILSLRPGKRKKR